MAVAYREVVVASRKSDRASEMGQEIARLRKERGFTQAALAGRLALSLEGYRMYEKGYSRVRAEAIPKWARALDMPAPELAARLGIELGVEANASPLARQVAAILGPERGDMIEQIVNEIADLPEADQRVVLDGMRDQIAGRKARLRLVN